MANELEDALAGMGFNFSDTPDAFEDKAEETPAVEEQPQEEVEAAQAEAPVDEEVAQESESSLQEEDFSEEVSTEHSEEPTEEYQPEQVSDEVILSAVSETLGMELTSLEDLQGILNKEQP